MSSQSIKRTHYIPYVVHYQKKLYYKENVLFSLFQVFASPESNCTNGKRAVFLWIGEKVWIDNLAQVDIHANVSISQGAMLLTGNHNYKSESFDLIVSPITLEEGVWIGAQAVVCPGVTCASHAILSVASVATRNLDAFFIYQGNPAIRVRERIIH